MHHGREGVRKEPMGEMGSEALYIYGRAYID